MDAAQSEEDPQPLTGVVEFGNTKESYDRVQTTGLYHVKFTYRDGVFIGEIDWSEQERPEDENRPCVRMTQIPDRRLGKYHTPYTKYEAQLENDKGEEDPLGVIVGLEMVEVQPVEESSAPEPGEEELPDDTSDEFPDAGDEGSEGGSEEGSEEGSEGEEPDEDETPSDMTGNEEKKFQFKFQMRFMLRTGTMLVGPPSEETALPETFIASDMLVTYGNDTLPTVERICELVDFSDFPIGVFDYGKLGCPVNLDDVPTSRPEDGDENTYCIFQNVIVKLDRVDLSHGDETPQLASGGKYCPFMLNVLGPDASPTNNGDVFGRRYIVEHDKFVSPVLKDSSSWETLESKFNMELSTTRKSIHAIPTENNHLKLIDETGLAGQYGVSVDDGRFTIRNCEYQLAKNDSLVFKRSDLSPIVHNLVTLNGSRFQLTYGGTGTPVHIGIFDTIDVRTSGDFNYIILGEDAAPHYLNMFPDHVWRQSEKKWTKYGEDDSYQGIVKIGSNFYWVEYMEMDGSSDSDSGATGEAPQDGSDVRYVVLSVTRLVEDDGSTYIVEVDGKQYSQGTKYRVENGKFSMNNVNYHVFVAQGSNATPEITVVLENDLSKVENGKFKIGSKTYSLDETTDPWTVKEDRQADIDGGVSFHLDDTYCMIVDHNGDKYVVDSAKVVDHVYDNMFAMDGICYYLKTRNAGQELLRLSIPESMRTKLLEMLSKSMLLTDSYFKSSLTQFKQFLELTQAELNQSLEHAEIMNLCAFSYDAKATFPEHARLNDPDCQDLKDNHALFGESEPVRYGLYQTGLNAFDDHLYNQFFNDFS